MHPMIYFLGEASELMDIRKYLDHEYSFKLIDNLQSSGSLQEGELFVIGSSIDNPVKLVQDIFIQDNLLSVIILTLANRYSQIKKRLQFSMSVGKNANCVVYNPSMNYSPVFNSGIIRTRQKRSFSKFSVAVDKKLSHLTAPSIKLDNLGHILEHAPIGAILVNDALRVIGANKNSREMFHQLHGGHVPLESLFPRNYIEIVRRIRLKEVEEPLAVEDVNGSHYEIITSFVPGEDESNAILLINDVTERMETTRRIDGILESLPHIAWTADPEGNITYYNQGWFVYTNTQPSEGFGEKWITAIHPDDVNLLVGKWRASIKSLTTFQHIFRFRRFDGQYRWHLAKGTPIFTKNRTLDMWVGTATDIDDQVRMNEQLEQKVKARTKLLEESNAELEQFAYISSHDLQEPLRKIQTFAHIVKDDGSHLLSENLRRYIDKIIDTSSRMSRLLKDLLNFTKINQQEAESLVDLNDIVHQIEEDLELALTQNQARFSSQKLPIIKGRPLQLKQLFYNLINNSIKYRKPEQPPVIAITCTSVEPERKKIFQRLGDNEYWEIIVKDNGIGFEAKYADQIFTVFQRLHTRTSYEGTGIGLAIAKKVVTNHGGEIFAISSPGEGAEFHLILPTADD